MPIQPISVTTAAADPVALARQVKALARGFGFQRCGIAGIELGPDEDHLRDWLAQGGDPGAVEAVAVLRFGAGPALRRTR